MQIELSRKHKQHVKWFKILAQHEHQKLLIGESIFLTICNEFWCTQQGKRLAVVVSIDQCEGRVTMVSVV